MVREKLACRTLVASFFGRKIEQLPPDVRRFIRAECSKGALTEWQIVLGAARLMYGKPALPGEPEPTPEEWEAYVRDCLEACVLDVSTPEVLDIIWEGFLSSPRWTPQQVADEIRKRLKPNSQVPSP